MLDILTLTALSIKSYSGNCFVVRDLLMYSFNTHILNYMTSKSICKSEIIYL